MKARALVAAVALVWASTAEAKEPPQKLFCAVGRDVAYFATFDSGEGDKGACQVTAKMWEMFLQGQEIKAKCWCAPITQA